MAVAKATFPFDTKESVPTNTLEEKYDSAVALFLPGVFGNVRPYLNSGDHFRSGTESEAISCGHTLAKAVEDGIENCCYLTVNVLNAWRSKPHLPLDKPLSKDELGTAHGCCWFMHLSPTGFGVAVGWRQWACAISQAALLFMRQQVSRR